MNVALVVTQGPLSGDVFRFSKPEVTVGREGTDIVLGDPEISAVHCAVEVRGNHAILTDMGSTNGTYQGEEPVKSCRLEHLSEFRIGGTTLMFTITSAE
jgi:S-DNA-T family DNA segregation ATPase FtsK/SpoIIIE